SDGISTQNCHFIPRAVYKLTTSKSGCGQVPGSPVLPPSIKQFKMGAYASTQHLALDCQQ
ncbi:MAG: hypothetical protein L0229_09375, partial [Blastocatellia bacterium]|nr:hypothetical protein [Blastocatellia bacterium]